MPPIRRYLRITQYSVLECRIYLDNPADAQRWLLNERSPVLPRVIEAVRPFVLPKLREENVNAKSSKGGKRKGYKDVVVEDDFEVAVFLTEISSRHAILHKEKRAKTERPRLGTTKGRLTGQGTQDVPIEVGESAEPAVLREDSEEEKLVDLANIPTADSQEPSAPDPSLFIVDDSDQGSSDPAPQIRKNLRRNHAAPTKGDADEEDKKKLGLNTSYDGCSIYGRILCLVVKRRGKAKGKDPMGGASQAMMEEWIASTQMADAHTMDD
ncbi:MAG: hypothetical protein Q9194_005640 [Teloschistes cf. exilis]